MVETTSPEAIPAASAAQLSALADFLVHPRQTVTPWLAQSDPLPAAIKIAAVMLGIGASAAAALKVGKDIELSSIAFITVGTVAIWVLYGLFLHVCAYVAGARRGFRYTIAAYLYVIGFLQPVLVGVLWAIVWLFPDAISYREISIGLGGSGAAQVLTAGNFFSLPAVALYRLASGTVILFYFAACLAPAQGIGTMRSAVAAIISFAFFLIVFLVMSLASQLGLDFGLFKRLAFG
jgi:hypothetical protein